MIHKTAIIDSKAKISKNVKVGPYSVIGPNVEIGENTEIHSHVNISGYTKIGQNNKIYPFASIGTNPQDLKYGGEKTNLEIQYEEERSGDILHSVASIHSTKEQLNWEPNISLEQGLSELMKRF